MSNFQLFRLFQGTDIRLLVAKGTVSGHLARLLGISSAGRTVVALLFIILFVTPRYDFVQVTSSKLNFDDVHADEEYGTTKAKTKHATLSLLVLVLLIWG
eukprot:scaffold591439_cov28-Prasinocladus_malaysianus.AAC.1